MVMIGTDSHKRTHTAVALDEVGRRLADKMPATSDGHFALVRWAQQWPQVSFAAEDCRNMTRRLGRDLLAAGHRLVRVPTRLMAQGRPSGRQPGKSDLIDAEAVALAALRHHHRLPVAELDSPTRQVKLLVDHRRDLVGERTRVVNRLRWHLHELDPALQVPARGLRSYCAIDRLGEHLATVTGLVARLARELLHRCRELTMQINALWRELHDLVKSLAPAVLAIPGCGVLSAAMILGETAGVHRFRSRDAYARFTGTAPIPAWSGNTAGKVRLNRGGNRTLNSALHMIAITQSRGIGPGAIYLDKLTASGKPAPKPSGCCAGASLTPSTPPCAPTNATTAPTPPPPNQPTGQPDVSAASPPPDVSTRRDSFEKWIVFHVGTPRMVNLLGLVNNPPGIAPDDTVTLRGRTRP